MCLISILDQVYLIYRAAADFTSMIIHHICCANDAPNSTKQSFNY